MTEEIENEDFSQEEYDSELELRFEKSREIVFEEMAKLTKQANAIFTKMEELSEEQGIPIDSYPGKYVPASMKKLWGDGNTVYDDFSEYTTDYRCYGRLPEGEWWSPSTC